MECPSKPQFTTSIFREHKDAYDEKLSGITPGQLRAYLQRNELEAVLNAATRPKRRYAVSQQFAAPKQREQLRARDGCLFHYLLLAFSNKQHNAAHRTGMDSDRIAIASFTISRLPPHRKRRGH